MLFYEYVFFTIFPVSQNFSGPVRTIIEILFVFQGLYNHERIKCYTTLVQMLNSFVTSHKYGTIMISRECSGVRESYS